MLAEKRHLERVQAVVEGDGPTAQDPISASWKRSAVDFGVDAASNLAPRILTTGELRDHTEKAQAIVFAAQEELDQLFRISRLAGYVALMSNENGVIVDHRLEEEPSSRFTEWGNLVGGVWSEEAEGTNGTGTCIAERRAITIHRSDHFRFRHIGSSCSAAPIFGVNDDLIGVLDISSTDPTLSENAHKLAGALVSESARSIEERHFREQFRRHWIIAVACPGAPGCTALMAVNKDRQIVGLDHVARTSFARAEAPPGLGSGFWTLFERDDAAFGGKNGDGDRVVGLTLIDGTETLPALITPPEPPAAIWRNAESHWSHCRPRKGLLTGVPQSAVLRQSAGALPPRALRRVLDYIDSHLHENLGLEQLAQTANMSLYHFARAFKASTGVPPHRFVLQRRIHQACNLLARTNRSIAEIAVATGFTDQSHLARHLRKSLAVSPGTFRRSHR